MVQPGATGRADDGHLPPGCIPLFEVEEHVRRLVMRTASRLPTEFSGARPTSFWPDFRDEMRQRRIWDVPDLSKIIGGITSHLMERLIESANQPIDELAQPSRAPSIIRDGYEAREAWCASTAAERAERVARSESAATPSRVFLFHGGDLYPVYLPDALYLADPAKAPRHCETKADASGFAEFYANRLSQHPFLDRASWSLLISPGLHLAGCKEEQEEMRSIWTRLAPLAGAQLVYREAVDWQGRDWKAASQVVKAVEENLKHILDGKIPARGAGFEEAVQEALRFYASVKAEQKSSFTYEMLADHFRVEGPPRNNRRLRDLWATMCDRLPKEEAQRLRKPGRRPRSTSG